MKKLIKDMNYLELEEFLNQDIKLSERQLVQVRNHKNVDDVRFWTRKGNIREYTVDIINDKLFLYSSVDIEVKDEE